MTLQLLAILTAAGGIGLLALTHNAAAEYFMFSVLLALVVVCYALSRLSVRGLELGREVADQVFEGEPMAVRLALGNRGRLPRFLVDVTDTLPDYLEADREPTFAAPSLWPRERVSAAYTVRASKRGVYRWPPSRVSAADPFGVFLRYVPVETAGEAVVYPRPLDLRGGVGQLGVEARSQAAGERARGGEAGLDFYGIRDYRPGDELRRIHWPATARYGRLTVIEFDRGASEDVTVVLDAAAGSEFGRGLETTLEVGVRAAASLVHWALASEGVGSLAFSAPGGPSFLSVDRPEREHEILEALARAQAEGGMSISALVDWAGRQAAPNTSLVVITAAPDAALPAVLAGMRQQAGAISVILLDARSFDRSAPDSRVTAAALAGSVQVVAVARGDDLREALIGTLTGER